jgi:hypothetical protein
MGIICGRTTFIFLFYNLSIFLSVVCVLLVTEEIFDLAYLLQDLVTSAGT